MNTGIKETAANLEPRVPTRDSAIVRISPFMLLHMLGWPDDVVIDAAQVGFIDGALELKLTHRSLQHIPQSSLLPIVHAVYETNEAPGLPGKFKGFM